jgi:hypothetical protein
MMSTDSNPSLRANGSRGRARPMTGSAKQSRRASGKDELDCFVADAPLRKRFAFVAGNDENDRQY